MRTYDYYCNICEVAIGRSENSPGRAQALGCKELLAKTAPAGSFLPGASYGGAEQLFPTEWS